MGLRQPSRLHDNQSTVNGAGTGAARARGGMDRRPKPTVHQGSKRTPPRRAFGRPQARPRRPGRVGALPVLGVALLVALAVASLYLTLKDARWQWSAAWCTIKGNISQDTGERIYHLPGDEFYGRTWINPLQA